jgi:hypothetical protein
MYLIKKILLKPFENIITQAILEWNVSNSLTLMGIGIGGDVKLISKLSLYIYKIEQMILKYLIFLKELIGFK